MSISFGCLKLDIFSDGFGAVEENIFMNVYFTEEEIKNAETIVDLGAHHGSFTVWSILKSSPGSTIITVEPNPVALKLCLDNVRKLTKVIKAKNLKVKIMNVAVWDTEGLVASKEQS